MVLLITNALVETLVKHMFQKQLNEMDKIEIGGAPSWYMKPVKNEMCVFAHKNGGMDMIDLVKDKTRYKMKKKIDGTIEIVIYDNMKNVKNKKEREVIDAWKVDENLKVFVNKHINFSRVAFEDEINTTFVRACIPNQTIIDYQKERLELIKKEVLKVKVNNAFDEMNSELEGGSGTKDKNDPFAELPN